MPTDTAKFCADPHPDDLAFYIKEAGEAHQDYLLAKAEREAAEANGTDTNFHYYSEVSCFDYWQDMVTEVARVKDYLAKTKCASEREGYCPSSAWSFDAEEVA